MKEAGHDEKETQCARSIPGTMSTLTTHTAEHMKHQNVSQAAHPYEKAPMLYKSNLDARDLNHNSPLFKHLTSASELYLDGRVSSGRKELPHGVKVAL